MWPIKLLFRFIFQIRKKDWQHPVEGFEENPAYFKIRDVLYLATKYYAKPHETLNPQIPQKQLNEIDPSAERIILHAGGDLMPYEVMLHGKSEQLWSLCGASFFGADLVMANLETPLDFNKPPSFVPELMLNDMMFNGNRALWDIFTDKGKFSYHYLSLANNHMLDSGNSSLKATMNWLDSRGVLFSGARRNYDEPNFALLERKGIRMAVVNYTYSLNRVIPDAEAADLISHIRLNNANEDIGPLYSDLQDARSKGAEFVIASLHMGNAYQCYPSSHIRARVKEIFENGCPDLILIHHPHNLQPSEVLNYTRKTDGKSARGLVYYSLGDFVAYDIFSWSHLTGYARLEIARGADGKILMNSGFEFLYLFRNAKGEFSFVPWKMAMEEKEFQDEHYYYLKDWYDRHASRFYSS